MNPTANPPLKSHAPPDTNDPAFRNEAQLLTDMAAQPMDPWVKRLLGQAGAPVTSERWAPTEKEADEAADRARREAAEAARLAASELAQRSQRIANAFREFCENAQRFVWRVAEQAAAAGDPFDGIHDEARQRTDLLFEAIAKEWRESPVYAEFQRLRQGQEEIQKVVETAEGQEEAARVAFEKVVESNPPTKRLLEAREALEKAKTRLAQMRSWQQGQLTSVRQAEAAVHADLESRVQAAAHEATATATAELDAVRREAAEAALGVMLSRLTHVETIRAFLAHAPRHLSARAKAEVLSTVQ